MKTLEGSYLVWFYLTSHCAIPGEGASSHILQTFMGGDVGTSFFGTFAILG